MNTTNYSCLASDFYTINERSVRNFPAAKYLPVFNRPELLFPGTGPQIFCPITRDYVLETRRRRIFAITPTVSRDFHFNENHRYCYCAGETYFRGVAYENGLNALWARAELFARLYPDWTAEARSINAD